ncbi:putative sugar nucleotidyl transferase [Aquirufa sp. ROCK2-A2]
MWNSICLFNDQAIKKKLRPITDHRNIWDLIIGTSSILEKWQSQSKEQIQTRDIDSDTQLVAAEIFIVGSALPTDQLLQQLNSLATETALFVQNQLIAFKTNTAIPDIQTLKKIEIQEANYFLNTLEDSLKWNPYFLEKEIQTSSSLYPDLIQQGNLILNPTKCQIDPSANIKGCIIDASSGPVFIGKNVQLQLGTFIQGPACILEGASTNLGTKIRPNCTIGQGCKIGGEINHSIFYPFSNKAHEGYIGSSIVGSFSNLGALTTCSNVRNDLKTIDLFDYSLNGYRPTPEKNLGIFMGDYVTTGVGTKFNTGTVIGSHANISTTAFPPKYIPSFTWGEFPNFKEYHFDKAFEVAKAWISLKGQNIQQNLKQSMEEIWKEKSTFRT